MEVLDLGLIDYPSALQTQEERVAYVRANPDKEALLVCEHPLVVTVGRALGAKDDVLDPEVQVVEVSRGGRSTLHAPGQVVIYPILNLEKRRVDLVSMLRLLEKAIIETLREFDLEAYPIEGKTGVWVRSNDGSEKKIASLGIALRQGVSFHGLALNVVNDLDLFKKINPCGFSSNVMTSVKKEMNSLVRDEDLKIQVRKQLLVHLQSLFEV